MASPISTTNQQILSAISILSEYVGAAIFFLGTIGNVMNIIVFTCLKSYRSLVTSTFLFGASLFAQVFLILSFGFRTLSKWAGYDIASRNEPICKFTLLLRTASIQIYLTCLCLASIDRYLMTSRSVRRRELITLRRARLAVVVCVVVWMCARIPYAIFSLTIPALNMCAQSLNFIDIATYMTLVLSVISPVTILSVFGILTWKNLGNIRLSAMNAQVTRMILSDVTVMAVSNLPVGIFLLYAVTTIRSFSFTPTEMLFGTLTQLASSIQTFGSFYFYLMISSTFRKNVKNMLFNLIYFWKPRAARQVAPSGRTGAITAIQTKTRNALH